jgi:hypothetical protein
MKVYMIDQLWLNDVLNTNRYSAIGLVDQKTGKFDQRYSENFFRNFSLKYSRNQPIVAVWKHPNIEEFQYKDFPFPDVTRIAGEATVYLFSQATLEKIGSVIKNDGEILAFQGKKLPYSWFRILKVLNVLETEDAIGFTNNPEYIPYFEKYNFYADRLENTYLFHIVNHPGTFATDLFVDLVRKYDLKGLDFLLIWDSENPDYIDERFKPEVWAEIKTRHAKRQIL